MVEPVTFVFNLFVLLSFFGALISFSLALLVWVKRRGPVVITTFVALMVGLGLWSFFQGLEYGFTSLEAKRAFGIPMILAMLGSLASWLLFALAYAGYDGWVNRYTIGLLALEPSLFLLLALTNDTHQLLWTSVSLNEFRFAATLSFVYAPGFWLHILYSYLLLLWGTVLIVGSIPQASPLYHRQVALILLSVSLPWGGNVLFLLGVAPVDPTPFAFALTGLVLAWGLLNLHLLEIVPLARTAVFTSLNDAILIIDEKERLLDFNLAARLLLPAHGAATIGQPLDALLPDLARLLQPPSQTQAEVSLSLDGNRTIYDLHLSPIHDRRQRLVGRAITLRDVTTRKLAEQSEREQRILAEALRDVAVILNNTLDLEELLRRILTEVSRVVPHDTANIMLLQGGMAKVVGYHGFSEDEIARAPQEWVVEKTPNLKRMSETGEPVIVADTRLCDDWIVANATEWIRSHLGAPILREGEVLGFINVESATPNQYHPKDARRLQGFANQAAIALWNARLFAELTARNQELDAFAHTIAHDLQAPLNLIQGYAEMIGDYELPSASRAHLDTIQVTIERMGQMIEQLLLLARLRDASKTAVSLDTRPVLEAAIARFKPQIEARGIILWIEPDLLPVMGHASWLEEVFANLIGNAIKYIGSENQEPVIQIRSRPREGQVYYEVKDNGLGVDPANQLTIFEMFARFHRQEASGSGIGLAIVQRIIHKLGGQVGVKSLPGQGSTFWFTLPAPPEP